MTVRADIPELGPGPAGLTLIFPVAGGPDFRGFETARGESLIRRSLRSFHPFLHRIDKVCYIVLEEHDRRFDIAGRLARETDPVPATLVRLSAPTAGPAETVARGVAKAGITGAALVCDIDHRLDLAPLFDRIDASPDAPCLASLWPLKGEDLKRWSVACVDGQGAIAAVRERRLPEAPGRFFGVIGCHYFADVRGVMDICLERGFTRFSDYCNGLARAGTPAFGVRLADAEFFGDAERIRRLEEGAAGPRGTIFCDIDGTLIVHEDTPDYSRPPRLLPGSRETLRRWIEDGFCVVLCTARRKEDEGRLVEMLREIDIPYHQILTGLPSGTRVLINDRKPHEMFTAQAATLEIARDAGIAGLKIRPASRPLVLRRFEGGSFAETLLLEEEGQSFVRKRAPKSGDPIGYRRLRDQFRTVERFAQIDPGLVPRLLGEENNSHEYFYDMEFLAGHASLAECDGPSRAGALDRLFDRLDRHLYSHRNARPGACEDWYLRHLDAKIAPKLTGLAGHERLAPLLMGEGVEIDGVHYPSLGRLLARMRGKEAMAAFMPRFLSQVHGDLTFQNVMVRPDGDIKLIDMEAPDGLEAPELDLGKLLQSTHSQYETWSRLPAPLCAGASPAQLTLSFTPALPDAGLKSAVRRRWAQILDCAEDTAELRGRFYLGLHLVRMVPFRLKCGIDQAVYALATALVELDRALDTA